MGVLLVNLLLSLLLLLLLLTFLVNDDEIVDCVLDGMRQASILCDAVLNEGCNCSFRGGRFGEKYPVKWLWRSLIVGEVKMSSCDAMWCGSLASCCFCLLEALDG